VLYVRANKRSFALFSRVFTSVSKPEISAITTGKSNVPAVCCPMKLAMIALMKISPKINLDRLYPVRFIKSEAKRRSIFCAIIIFDINSMPSMKNIESPAKFLATCSGLLTLKKTWKNAISNAVAGSGMAELTNRIIAIKVIPITASASELRLEVGCEYAIRNIKDMARKNHFLRNKMKKMYRNIFCFWKMKNLSYLPRNYIMFDSS
jgi:hypothetical protein